MATSKLSKLKRAANAIEGAYTRATVYSKRLRSDDANSVPSQKDKTFSPSKRYKRPDKDPKNDVEKYIRSHSKKTTGTQSGATATRKSK